MSANPICDLPLPPLDRVTAKAGIAMALASMRMQLLTSTGPEVMHVHLDSRSQLIVDIRPARDLSDCKCNDRQANGPFTHVYAVPTRFAVRLRVDDARIVELFAYAGRHLDNHGFEDANDGPEIH